jgi:hypothetical protein
VTCTQGSPAKRETSGARASSCLCNVIHLLSPLTRLSFQHNVPRQLLLAMTLFRQNALNCLKQSCAPVARVSVLRTSHRTPQWLPAWQRSSVSAFSSTGPACKKGDLAQKQEQDPEASSKELPQKAERTGPRKNAGKTSSLRRVAVEAQRSRGFVKGKGSKRFVDPDVETKVRTPS